MRLIYLWTHVSRAHVHVYRMNFIGLCACLLACAWLRSVCVYVHRVRLCINTMIPFNWNWQMNLSSIWNESEWKPHRKLLPSLMCVDDILSISRSIDYVIQKFRLLSKWCATVCVSAYVWMVIWQLLISLHTWIASSQDLLGARNQTKKRGPHKELNESIHR